jgi:signal transduction histidine kinase
MKESLREVEACASLNTEGCGVFTHYYRLFLTIHESLFSADTLEDMFKALGEGLKSIIDIAGIILVFKDENLPQKELHFCFSDHSPPEAACQHVSQLASKVFETRSPFELSKEDLGGVMKSGMVYPLFFHNRVEAALGFFCFSPVEVLRDKLEGIKRMLPEIGLMVGSYRLWWEKEVRRRQWETAMEALDDAVFVVDIRSNKISFSNRAALMLLGEGVATQSPIPIKSCKIPVLCRLCDSIKDSVVRSKTPKDSRFIDRNTTYSLRAYPVINDVGEVESLLFVLRDITQEVRRNLNLIKSERLEAISEVLEGVTHSLNNPITAVVGFSQFLLERDDIPEDAKEMLRVIEREGKRCSEVVSRLLSFVGSREGEEGQVDINGVVSNIALLRGEAMFKRGVDLELDLDPNIQFVWGESHAIQLALVNIVLNAEKVVSDRTGKIRISTRQVDDWVEILVEDNGPGIPLEIREKIFSPFFTTDVTRGTGLGLSIALAAIEDHGGKIEVGESLDLGGALFRVLLPLPARGRSDA